MTAIIAVHNWRVGPRFLDDPIGLKGQRDLVHTRQPPLALLDDLRFEVAVAAARDLEPDVAVLSVSVGLWAGSRCGCCRARGPLGRSSCGVPLESLRGSA
jgi:hypothetical protein